MSDSDFNPLVFKEVPKDEDSEPNTIATGVLDIEGLQYKGNIQQNYQNLLEQHQQLEAQYEQLHDNVLALADIMYQMLTFINAQRLYQNHPPIMANDIANVIEVNPIMAEITANLRDAAIKSTLGLISQFDDAQNYLRTNVMQVWQERFASDERAALAAKLFVKTEEPEPPTTETSSDEVF